MDEVKVTNDIDQQVTEELLKMSDFFNMEAHDHIEAEYRKKIRELLSIINAFKSGTEYIITLDNIKYPVTDIELVYDEIYEPRCRVFYNMGNKLGIALTKYPEKLIKIQKMEKKVLDDQFFELRNSMTKALDEVIASRQELKKVKEEYDRASHRNKVAEMELHILIFKFHKESGNDCVIDINGVESTVVDVSISDKFGMEEPQYLITYRSANSAVAQVTTKELYPIKFKGIINQDSIDTE